MADRSIASINLWALAKERVPTGTLPAAEDYAAGYVLFTARKDNVPAPGSILNYYGGLGIRGLRQTMAGKNLPERISEMGKGIQ